MRSSKPRTIPLERARSSGRPDKVIQAAIGIPQVHLLFCPRRRGTRELQQAHSNAAPQQHNSQNRPFAQGRTRGFPRAVAAALTPPWCTPATPLVPPPPTHTPGPALPPPRVTTGAARTMACRATAAMSAPAHGKALLQARARRQTRGCARRPTRGFRLPQPHCNAHNTRNRAEGDGEVNQTCV